MPKTPPSKLAFSRIVEIDRLLRAKQHINLNSLAEHFGVSRRSIERDIESMRDYFDAPIVFDHSRRTHKYSKRGFSLPSISLSEKELFTILVAERSLRQYKGTPFEPIIHRAFNKLVSLLPGEQGVSVDVADLCNAIVFQQGPPVSEYDPEIFNLLLEAIARERQIEIRYFAASSNKETTRKVDPYHIANWGGDWYLIASCKTRKDIRNFHLARIREAKKMDHFFSRPTDWNPRKYMSAGFGQMTGPKKETFKVRIVPPAANWAKEKIWHPTQVVAHHRDGSIDITMQVSGTDAIVRWVLQFGSSAELLEPRAMRKDIAQELKKAAGKYGKGGNGGR